MTVDRWQKTIWRQAWDVARVGSLFLLIPIAATVGMQKWQQAEQRRHFSGVRLSGAVFAPYEHLMISAGANTRPDQQSSFVAAWDSDSGKKRWHEAIAGRIADLAVSPDGRRLLVVNKEATRVDVRDVATGRLLQTLKTFDTSSVGSDTNNLAPDLLLDNTYRTLHAAWLAGGKGIAVGEPGWLALYPDCSNPANLVKVNLPNSGTTVEQIENLTVPDAFLTTTQSGALVQVRSAKDGRVLRTLESGLGLTASVLPDGKRVAVRNLDKGRITLYHAATGEMLAVANFTPKYASTFQVVDSALGLGYVDVMIQNPPGQLDSKTSLPTPRLYRYRWQLKTGIVRPVIALTLEKGRFAFSADGKLLVSLREGNGEQHPALAIQHDPQNGAMTGRFEGNAGW